MECGAWAPVQVGVAGGVEPLHSKVNPVESSFVLNSDEVFHMCPSLCLFVLLLAGAAAQEPDVQEIMARLARNQDRAQEVRANYVYNQRIILRFKRSSGKVAREEIREYSVAPTADGTAKELRSFSGKYEKGGKLLGYDKPGFQYKDVDLDGELIDDLADDLTNEKGSRDGVSMDLFPLRSNQQRKYLFALAGKEDYRGKQVYRITFKPRRESWDDDEGGTPWAGEILVDSNEFQPVFISTRLARGLPLFVKTVLGTNLKGLGFKLTYEKFEDGVWFPMIYGAEFELKAAFFYKRKIALALNNSDFKRAQVQTKVSFDEPLLLDPVLRVNEIKESPSPTPQP